MNVPTFTELSNFMVRRNGKRLTADISIVMIVRRSSEPVETLNSIRDWITGRKDKIEVLLINIDREGYKYETLLKTFPALRILLPQSRIDLKDAIHLAVSESLARQVLFVNEQFVLENLDLQILNSYFSQSNFGGLVPILLNPEREIVPNIIKAGMEHGFLNTITVDIKGTAVATLYPNYFCFIVNRDVFLERDLELRAYNRDEYVFLELGYRIWKEGFFVSQAPNFRVRMLDSVKPDLRYDPEDRDCLVFNYRNLNDKEFRKQRDGKLRARVSKYIITFRFAKAAKLIKLWRETQKIPPGKIAPVDDMAVIHTINRDYE